MMNSKTIVVLGRVGNVRVFDGEDGRKTVVFGVAVDQPRRGEQAEGEQKPPAVWTSFRAVNGTAEMLAQYLTKGRLVHVVGTSPRLRQYETLRTINIKGVGNVQFKDVQTAEEYIVVDFKFADAPRSDADGQLVGEVVAGEPAGAASGDAEVSSAAMFDLKDIPF